MKNKQNIVFICIVVGICVLILIFGMFRSEGARAVVQFGNGESVNISLKDDGIHTLINGELPIHLEVSGGKIRFVDSECPDHVCEGFGWLSKEEDQAICAPARATVGVEP